MARQAAVLVFGAIGLAVAIAEVAHGRAEPRARRRADVPRYDKKTGAVGGKSGSTPERTERR